MRILSAIAIQLCDPGRVQKSIIVSLPFLKATEDAQEADSQYCVTCKDGEMGTTGQVSPNVEYAPSVGAGGGTRYWSWRFSSAELGTWPDLSNSTLSEVKNL